MGTLLHFALSFIVVQGAFGNALTYIVPILVFSTGIDLDHIPFILRTRHGWLQPRMTVESRSRFHELFGLLVFSAGFSILSAFCDIALVKVVALATTMHYTVDFLVRRTRPLYPFSNQEVFLRKGASELSRDHAFDRDRFPHIRRIREVVEPILLRLPLPRFNPSVVSGLSVLTSLAFVLVLRRSTVAAAIMLAVTLVLDLLDGLIAKQHGLSSTEGHVADVMADRLSEAILTIPFFVPWFYLFLLNGIIAIISITKRRHVIQPLRGAFFIWFLVASL